jgi:hypothetical protein
MGIGNEEELELRRGEGDGRKGKKLEHDSLIFIVTREEN